MRLIISFCLSRAPACRRVLSRALSLSSPARSPLSSGNIRLCKTCHEVLPTDLRNEIMNLVIAKGTIDADEHGPSRLYGVVTASTDLRHQLRRFVQDNNRDGRQLVRRLEDLQPHEGVVLATAPLNETVHLCPLTGPGSNDPGGLVRLLQCNSTTEMIKVSSIVDGGIRWVPAARLVRRVPAPSFAAQLDAARQTRSTGAAAISAQEQLTAAAVAQGAILERSAAHARAAAAARAADAAAAARQADADAAAAQLAAASRAARDAAAQAARDARRSARDADAAVASAEVTLSSSRFVSM